MFTDKVLFLLVSACFLVEAHRHPGVMLGGPKMRSIHEDQQIPAFVNKVRALAFYLQVSDADKLWRLARPIRNEMQLTKRQIIEKFRAYFDEIPVEKKVQTFSYLKEIENLFNDLDISLQIECEDLQVILRKMRRANLVPLDRPSDVDKCDQQYAFSVSRAIFGRFENLG